MRLAPDCVPWLSHLPPFPVPALKVLHGGLGANWDMYCIHLLSGGFLWATGLLRRPPTRGRALGQESGQLGSPPAPAAACRMILDKSPRHLPEREAAMVLLDDPWGLCMKPSTLFPAQMDRKLWSSSESVCSLIDFFGRPPWE